MSRKVFEEIRGIVGCESYFDFDGYASDYEDDIDEDDRISFSTRDNGSVYDAECSDIDMQEAYRLKKLLEPQYPTLEFDVNYSDEWVFLEVKINLHSK